MAIEAVDWAIFIIVLFWLILLIASIEETSAVLDLFAGLATLLVASLTEGVLFQGVLLPDIVRWGVFILFILLAVILFIRGTLRLPEEVGR